MLPARRAPSLTLALAVALAAAACGAPPGDDVGPEPRAPTSVAETLRDGRAARVLVLLDDAPAVAAAALRSESQAALRGEGDAAEPAVLQGAKARVLARSAPGEVEELRRYTEIAALHVELRTPGALDRLLASPEVVRVVEDVPNEMFLAQSLPLVHQPAAISSGARGQGTAVAVLDTGVDYGRAAFGSCAAPGAPGCRVVFARDFAPDDGALDIHGHGTNVAAIVAGVAPGADLIALDVFNGKYAYTSDVLAAIDWAIRNRATYNIVAINLSLGSGGSGSPCQYDPFTTAIRTARAAGILSAAASGNDGHTDRISSPACTPDAISVGAVYDGAIGGLSFTACTDATTAANKVACFSNSAPYLTLLAPGGLISAGGATYVGTSQAAPHVAGAIAVMKSATPAATPDQLVARLRSGPLVGDPRNGVRTPRLDLSDVHCTADLSAAADLLDGAGAATGVEVRASAGCPWTIASGADWLELTPASGEGTTAVTVTARPNAGAPRTATLSAGGAAVTITQGTDRTVPTATLEIAGGAPYTRSLAVLLAVSGDDSTGLSQLCVSNTPACASWTAYTPSLRWTLAAGTSGPRSVYVRVKDGAGNASPAVRRTIVYDVVAPAGGTLSARAGAGAVSLSWPGIADPVSGVVRYALAGSAVAPPSSCAVGTLLYAGTATSFHHAGLAPGTRYHYRLCATDGAGNTSAGLTASVVAR
ncbi:MAG TPA: S8 family serine peptidase [Anaeromyxobacter sp.]|nr:S8 family serine peptidase [Anaeromyxobacter sp.]